MTEERKLIMTTTKVFTSGRSQAVRIPKEYRFDVGEVVINKIGDMVTLTPVSSLATEFDAGAALLDTDFLEQGMPDPIEGGRIDL